MRWVIGFYFLTAKSAATRAAKNHPCASQLWLRMRGSGACAYISRPRRDRKRHPSGPCDSSLTGFWDPNSWCRCKARGSSFFSKWPRRMHLSYHSGGLQESPSCVLCHAPAALIRISLVPPFIIPPILHPPYLSSSNKSEIDHALIDKCPPPGREPQWRGAAQGFSLFSPGKRDKLQRRFSPTLKEISVVTFPLVKAVIWSWSQVSLSEPASRWGRFGRLGIDFVGLVMESAA